VLDTLMDHVSAPYNSVERTKASYNLIFVRKLRPLSLHIFVVVSAPKIIKIQYFFQVTINNVWDPF